MKTVLKYPGAKNRLAPWIIEHIPKHDVYLEPFFGSGAILFNKPQCHIETVNDLHGEVVNYFKVLRDNPDKLIKAINNTPYSREEYDNAYTESESDLERARKFCARCWQGFGKEHRHTTFFRTKSKGIGVRCGCFYGTLEEFREQVKKTHGESRYAKEYLMLADLMEMHFAENREEKMTEICCGTCEHNKRTGEEFYCGNEEADEYGLETCYDDKCECWEKRK